MAYSEARATQLVFVRHGQSFANLPGAAMGSDSGLTEVGWRQAQAVADWLAHTIKADVLITSPLIRAQHTADVIGQRLGLSPSIQPGLEEAEQPYWEELPTTPPDDPLAYWDVPWQPTPEAAPVYYTFCARVRHALAEILRTHAGKAIIVVAHGGTIGTALRGLLGGHQMMMATENGSVSHVTWRDGRWQLVVHNSQAHLALANSAQGSALTLAPQPPSPWASSGQIHAVLEHYARVAKAYPGETAVTNGSYMRHLVEWASPKPDDVVLDVGCGTGAVSLAFAPHVRQVIGTDVSPAMLGRAEEARIARGVSNVRFRWAEATRLPVTSHSADVIVCRELLCYIVEPGELFVELRRALKAGGRLLLDELIGSDDPVRRATQEAIEICRDPSFLRVHSANEVKQLLAQAGFRIDKLQQYETARELEEWLASGAADKTAGQTVRKMLEASTEGNGAGLDVRLTRGDTLAFTQRRLRLLATADATSQA